MKRLIKFNKDINILVKSELGGAVTDFSMTTLGDNSLEIATYLPQNFQLTSKHILDLLLEGEKHFNKLDIYNFLTFVFPTTESALKNIPLIKDTINTLREPNPIVQFTTFVTKISKLGDQDSISEIVNNEPEDEDNFASLYIIKEKKLYKEGHGTVAVPEIVEELVSEGKNIESYLYTIADYEGSGSLPIVPLLFSKEILNVLNL